MKGINEMNGTNEVVISDKAKAWLEKHGYMGKAKRIEEHPDNLQFEVRKRKDHVTEVHSVQLSTGSWSAFDMPNRSRYR